MRELIKDLAKYSPAMVIPALVGLAEAPVMTHLFDAEEYGRYSIAFRTVWAMTLCTGWLAMSAIRFLPECRREGRLGQFFGSLLASWGVWVAVLTGGYLIVVAAIRSRVGDHQFHLLLIGAAVFVALAFFYTMEGFLRANRKPGWYSAFMGYHSVSRFGLALLLVMVWGMGVEGFLWGYVLSIGLISVLLWCKAVRSPAPAMTVSPSMVGAIGRYGFPLMVCALLAWALDNTCVYFLRFYHGQAEVGIFSASYNLAARGMLLLASLFQTASRPIEMRVWEDQGPEKSSQYATNLTRYYLLACVPFAGILISLAEPIISIFTESQYHSGYVIVPFVVAGGFLFGISQRYQVGLLLHKKTGLVMACFLIAGVLSLIANAVLIRWYGIVGAGAAVAASYVLLVATLVIASRRHFRFAFPLATLIRTCTATVVMGAAIYATRIFIPLSPPLKLILCATAGIGVYGATILILGEFRRAKAVAK